MTEHLLGLELAHWLIIAGLALVVLGSLGMVVRRRKQPESPTPGEATSVDDQVRMPWHQSRDTGAGHQSDKS
jgi:LPXTG-motif cell wall-anchored protein